MPGRPAEQRMPILRRRIVPGFVETVASGLEVPWAFAWLPNGDLIFTERPGRVRVIENGKLRTEPVFVVPDVEPSSESGLMDISLHPQFASNNYVYLAYAYSQD